MIVAHLTDDTHSLLTCSLTSRSWYTAAVPHLHRTLFMRVTPYNRHEKTKWPKPLRVASQFGFLPFVTRLFIHLEGCDPKFSSKQFHHRTLRDFSALTNVRELSIESLDIPSFMPKPQRYFGQFSQTLRSLTLPVPKGSVRQIVFFIGLFPHLEDLGLQCSYSFNKGELEDQTLFPPFVPTLRGRLVASGYGGDKLAKAMIDLFGRVRFHHMDLTHFGGVQLLLDSCADTLETFQLYATELRGGKISSKGVRVSTDYL
jgi:hypothetical protein